MPTSLSAAQSRAVGRTGESRDKFEFIIVKDILSQYAAEFAKEVENNIKQRQITASGELADNISVRYSNEGKTFEILMLDYFDFVNEGVKGVKSSKNASTSPYKFKNYGMSPEGRASIKQYILSGKAKISNKKVRGKTVMGLERKGIKASQKKSLIDMQVDELIYNIKKYGIKKTDYFTDAFEKVFANWERDISEALGEDVALSLTLKSSKK